VVVIEHDLPMPRSLADRLVALELGAIIAEGEPSSVLADARVIESYLGIDGTAVHRSGARSTRRREGVPIG
jgi:ABC-type uncharacterized transport system ATPase subunit